MAAKRAEGRREDFGVCGRGRRRGSGASWGDEEQKERKTFQKDCHRRQERRIIQKGFLYGFAGMAMKRRKHMKKNLKRQIMAAMAATLALGMVGGGIIRCYAERSDP